MKMVKYTRAAIVMKNSLIRFAISAPWDINHLL